MNPSPIAVGTATKAGLTGAGGSFALAIVAYATGDHSTVTVTALITGALTLLGTMAGRYAQAVAAHKPASITNITNTPTPRVPLSFAGISTESAGKASDQPPGGFGAPLASRAEAFEDDVDDNDLPAAGELPETVGIPAASKPAEPDQGDAGAAHVALARAEGGPA